MSKTIEPHILKQFATIRQMGSGAYGHVWQVIELRNNLRFALKKVFDAFRNSIDAQRTYRQVQVLHQLKHPNIIKLHRVMKAKNNKDLYMIFQYMEADLQSIVGTNILQKTHQIYIFYQTLKALKYIHSAQLIHRDLKPSNVLIDSECNIKLCDFGLIRSLASSQAQQVVLSQEVATKWYRAPELLLGSRCYGKPVDMWSFGCIVAEILIGKPLFAGDSTINQLQKILQFTGDIHKADIQALQSPVADQLISQIKIRKKSFRDYFSGIDPDFYELIKGLLQLNPNKRMTPDEALQLPLFNQFKGEILVTSNKPIVPVVDDNIRLGMKAYRQRIYEDIEQRYQSSFSKKNQSLMKNKENKAYSKQSKDNSKVRKRPFSAIQSNNIVKPIRTLSSNNKSRTVTKQKALIKKYHSNTILPQTKQLTGKIEHKNNHIKKQSPTSPYLRPNSKVNNAYLSQDINPLKRYQVKSPNNKLVKKTSKNKLFAGQKMEILKSLGFEKTRNLHKYMN